MGKLYLIKFEECVADTSVDSMPVQEVVSFATVAKSTGKYDDVVLISHSGSDDPTGRFSTIYYKNFINLLTTPGGFDISTDKLVFWSGYLHSTREHCMQYIHQFYEVMLRYFQAHDGEYVLDAIITDPRTPIMYPEYFETNPYFKNSPVLDTDLFDDIEILYYTQMRDLDMFNESVKMKEGTLSVFRHSMHMPLHILPSVIKNKLKTNQKPDSKMVVYGNFHEMLDSKRIQDLRLSINELGGSLVFYSNIVEGDDVSKQLPEYIEYRSKVPYSHIPEMLNDSFGSVVFQNDEYADLKLIPNRVVEGLCANTLVFIHEDLDPHREIIDYYGSTYHYFRDTFDLQLKYEAILNGTSYFTREQMIRHQNSSAILWMKMEMEKLKMIITNM